MTNRYFAVGIAGSIGALLRYGMTMIIPAMDNGFPLPTLVTNMIGSFILTFLAFYVFEKVKWSETLKTALSVGLIGAFTTFSAFSLETVTLVNSAEYMTAAAYVILSISGGLAMSYLGYLGQNFFGDKA